MRCILVLVASALFAPATFAKEKPEKFAVVEALPQTISGTATSLWPKATGHNFEHHKKILEKYQKLSDAAAKSIGDKQKNMFSGSGLCSDKYPCLSIIKPSIAHIDAKKGKTVKRVGERHMAALLDDITKDKQIKLTKKVDKGFLYSAKMKKDGVVAHVIGSKEKMDSQVVAGMYFDAWKMMKDGDPEKSNKPTAIRAIRAQTDGKPIELVSVCLYPQHTDKEMAKNFCIGKDSPTKDATKKVDMKEEIKKKNDDEELKDEEKKDDEEQAKGEEKEAKDKKSKDEKSKDKKKDKRDAEADAAFEERDANPGTWMGTLMEEGEREMMFSAPQMISSMLGGGSSGGQSGESSSQSQEGKSGASEAPAGPPPPRPHKAPAQKRHADPSPGRAFIQRRYAEADPTQGSLKRARNASPRAANAYTATLLNSHRRSLHARKVGGGRSHFGSHQLSRHSAGLHGQHNAASFGREKESIGHHFISASPELLQGGASVLSAAHGYAPLQQQSGTMGFERRSLSMRMPSRFSQLSSKLSPHLSTMRSKMSSLQNNPNFPSLASLPKFGGTNSHPESHRAESHGEFPHTEGQSEVSQTENNGGIPNREQKAASSPGSKLKSQGGFSPLLHHVIKQGPSLLHSGASLLAAAKGIAPQQESMMGRMGGMSEMGGYERRSLHFPGMGRLAHHLEHHMGHKGKSKHGHIQSSTHSAIENSGGIMEDTARVVQSAQAFNPEQQVAPQGPQRRNNQNTMTKRDLERRITLLEHEISRREASLVINDPHVKRFVAGAGELLANVIKRDGTEFTANDIQLFARDPSKIGEFFNAAGFATSALLKRDGTKITQRDVELQARDPKFTDFFQNLERDVKHIVGTLSKRDTTGFHTEIVAQQIARRMRDYQLAMHSTYAHHGASDHAEARQGSGLHSETLVSPGSSAVPPAPVGAEGPLNERAYNLFPPSQAQPVQSQHEQSDSYGVSGVKAHHDTAGASAEQFSQFIVKMPPPPGAHVPAPKFALAEREAKDEKKDDKKPADDKKDEKKDEKKDKVVEEKEGSFCKTSEKASEEVPLFKVVVTGCKVARSLGFKV